MLRIIVLSKIFLLLVLIPGGSCDAQVDVRLGSNEFFVGEKFLITGVQKRMNQLDREDDSEELMSNRIRVKRLIGSPRYPNRLEERMLSGIDIDPVNYFDRAEGEHPSTSQYRRGKRIGHWALPTGLEEQVNNRDLTEDGDNQLVNQEVKHMRVPRLIGPKKFPTQLEDIFLRRVSTDVDNVFSETD